jgi:hypothetical protein
MAEVPTPPGERRGLGVTLAPRGSRLIPVFALGMSLGLFLAISYLLCILFYVLFPDSVINHAVLSLFLPGFRLLSWPSFFLGLAEVFVFGWYIGLVFGPLYNFFALRWR